MLGNIAFLFFSSDGRNVGDKLFEDDNITLGKKKDLSFEEIPGNMPSELRNSVEFSR